MTAMNLVEYAKDADPLTRAYVEMYAEESDLLMTMPFSNTTGGAYKFIREGEGGTVAFRGVNEGFTASAGQDSPFVESLFIAGGDIDVDLHILRTQGRARKAREEKKKIKALARAITDAIITGDNATNPKEFDGLQRRITGNQKISNNTSSGGGALSLAALDEAISNTRNPTHLLMPRKLREVYFTALMRNQTLLGNVQMSKDDLGRPVMMYNGLPMLTGYPVGPETPILPFTEAASVGGQAQTTSIYVLSLTEGGVMGIQSAPMSVRDLGELDTAPVERTRIEWDVSMVIEDPYAATRLHDITDAAIVA